MAELKPTDADRKVGECLRAKRSFALVAAAGSGKTTSLVEALKILREQDGPIFRQNGQRIACVTFTKRAVHVIQSKLDFDDLYEVSTLHSFLWGEIGRFHSDIREALQNYRIPDLLEKAKERDNGRETREARKAREKAIRLAEDLKCIENVAHFTYSDTPHSDYRHGKLNHDDVIEVAGYLMRERPRLRRLLGLRYPYIFVDEAQDTFACIVEGLNKASESGELPLVGYFGDPWQQIYDGGMSSFGPPSNGEIITKVENFRCSKAVISLLNAFRSDVEQVAAGENASVQGSVKILLVQREVPQELRNRYSNAQLERALSKLDLALKHWNWVDRSDVIRLFLVRQMIARRLGFSSLNQLFTGPYASQHSQDTFEAGTNYLLQPFTEVLCPLLAAQSKGDSREVLDILRHNSPAFSVSGILSTAALKKVVDLAVQHVAHIAEIWDTRPIKDILLYCQEQDLISFSERLTDHLDRPVRSEQYDEDLHAEDKGDWLADAFFAMTTKELHPYNHFITENTPYSTQHGVKGEEYRNVLVVFDDVEAYWNNYNFCKLLTPSTVGEQPTEGQLNRGSKLAYVCFSRARENLRVLFFTPNPAAARQELASRLKLDDKQIEILS